MVLEARRSTSRWWPGHAPSADSGEESSLPLLSLSWQLSTLDVPWLVATSLQLLPPSPRSHLPVHLSVQISPSL